MAKKRKPDSISWRDFRIEYERHISRLKQSTQRHWYNAADALEQYCKPKLLIDVRESMLAKLVDKLRAKGLAESTIALHLTKIKAGLTWAWRRDFLQDPPRFAISELAKPNPPESAKAVSELEFSRILEAVPLVRKQDAPLWLRFLKAANWCDLRISELVKLSWDSTGDPTIVNTGEQYMFHFRGHDAQKAWMKGLHPMAPQFWEIVSKDDQGEPLREFAGYVFPLRGFEHPHVQMCYRGVTAIIRQIGELSGVVTQEETGKTATCHDFGRRVFVQRMLKQFPLHEVQRLVRHSDIRTTMKHYNSLAAKDLGAKLGWNA